MEKVYHGDGFPSIYLKNSCLSYRFMTPSEASRCVLYWDICADFPWIVPLHPEKEKTQSFIDRIVYGILVQKRGQTVPPPYVLWYLDTDTADNKNS